MGLSMSHGCWDGSYTGFNNFRRLVARVAGLPPLDMMDGFFRYQDIGDYPRAVRESLPIKWECLKDDPIVELLNHSDCDGIIPWGSCKNIAVRLKEIGDNVDVTEKNSEWGYMTDFLVSLTDMAEGMLKAYEAQEDVDFR